MTNRHGHNELLGGHGSDTIHAGPWGDVMWGDYKPSGQPTSQHDRIWGGAGRDHIYASHGRNAIRAGGGNDWIKAHFGGGLVNCGGGNDLLYISRRAQKHYKIRNCQQITPALRALTDAQADGSATAASGVATRKLKLSTRYRCTESASCAW